MPESFLALPARDRAEILETLALRAGRRAELLEKDVWICWALEHLFALPDRPAMVFKGGTSLSKAYGAIQRFSEDVDITLDCRELVAPFDPFAAGASRAAVQRHDRRLREAAAMVVRSVVRPGLQLAAQAAFGDACVFEVSDDGEHLWIKYASALPPATGYVRRHVDLEFGGRNSISPSEARTVVTDLAALTPGLVLPEARVDVLRPERTFWEKVTLIHAEVGRGQLRAGTERLSRHWHDVATLADHELGRRALVDRALLEDVVKFKRVFYPHPKADYGDCLRGRTRLLPQATMIEALRHDHDQMVRARMFDGEPPSFDRLLERLRRLEGEINRGSSL